MVYLALSVLCSSLIFVIFKLFDVYKIQTLYAIIVNYVVAFITGLFLYEGSFSLSSVMTKSWFAGTLALGVLFIVIFNLMARTSQVAGVSVASVATKMSLAIPVIFGVLMYKERLSMFQVMGILLALAAVYFASIKDNTRTVPKKALLLPLLVFLGSGIIDTSMKYFEERHLEHEEVPIFSSMIFGAAALTGLLFILIRAPKTSLKINLRNLAGGILLGVPNYFSIFFLIRALSNDRFASASIFTINNVAIVMFSTLLGILLFKEHMSIKNWAGIFLAVVSIVLVALF
nr:DMT family transporter [Allomuricauda sp.]